MTRDQAKEALVDACVNLAKVFLSEAGEFFPFAHAIGKEGEVISVGILMDDEHPRSVDVLDELSNAVLSKMQEGRYSFAAITTDVLVRGDHDPFDALAIKFMEPQMEDEVVYYRYYRVGQTYSFELVEL